MGQSPQSHLELGRTTKEHGKQGGMVWFCLFAKANATGKLHLSFQMNFMSFPFCWALPSLPIPAYNLCCRGGSDKEKGGQE